MNHLTQWKKEAREDMRASKGDWLTGEEISALFSIIDRIHAHTLEEVRGKVKEMVAPHEHDDEYCGPKHEDCADMRHEVGIYNTALSDVLAALELLEHPTD